VVYADGRARISSCGGAEGTSVAVRQLSDEQIASTLSWAASSTSFEYEETTGVGEDRVTTRVTFAGKGSRQVSRAEKQVLLQFLGTLVVTH